jgi:hypothetical protein
MRSGRRRWWPPHSQNAADQNEQVHRRLGQWIRCGPRDAESESSATGDPKDDEACASIWSPFPAPDVVEKAHLVCQLTNNMLGT